VLSEKSWKLDAVLRLFLSVLVCVLIGASVLGVVNYSGGPRKTGIAPFGALTLASLGLLIAALFALRKSWRLETFTRQFLTFLACIYGGMMLGWWAQHLAGAARSEGSAVQMTIATLSFQGAALLLITLFLKEHDVGWTDAFGFANDPMRALLFGAVTAFVFLPIGLGLQWLSAEVMTRLPLFPMKPEEQQAVQTLRVASSWLHRAVLSVVTILLAPAAEEFLFRGILYAWIKQAGFRRLAWWISCLLFAAMHLNLMTFLPLLVLAFVLTALYEKTNNLLAPIMAHALFNAVNLVRLYLLENQLNG
jgi:membrane protease YdiL (CAAX protease family)